MMDERIALSTRVTLERNYADIPFDLSKSEETADICISRTLNALSVSGARESWQQMPVRTLDEDQRIALVHMDLIDNTEVPLADHILALTNVNNRESILIGAGSHLRLQTCLPGMAVQECANRCFATDDVLSRQVHFAYDEQFGYLTSTPELTGTGMRARVRLHLPMLAWNRKMDEVFDLVASRGLKMEGVEKEGVYNRRAKSLGDVYRVSTVRAIGVTEQEMLDNLIAVCNEIADMENEIRRRDANDINLADKIYRAWGVLYTARLVDLREFYPAWSAVRLGMALGKISGEFGELDRLLITVQPTSLRVKTKLDVQRELHESQEARIRALLVRDVMSRTALVEE